MKSALVLLAAQSVVAFPFVADVASVKRFPDEAYTGAGHKGKRADTCPHNPVHSGAAPITDQFPYLGAKDGKKGTGKGGILVPAEGDTAHQFQAPGPLDIRGPCPGLNTLANHGFLSRDGLVTYNELVDAQQNAYNVGFNLANLLATAGVALTGDLITQRMSLGCSRDDWTNVAPGLLGFEPGLNAHNKFESDASLTRGDQLTGDDHTFNGTMFNNMAETCKGNFNRHNLALYRYQRYNEDRATNPDFFWGPGALLMYGAASFLYGSFPSYGLKGNPDLATQMSFFGAQGTPGNYTFNNAERFPDNWFSSVQPYDNNQIGPELVSMYLEYPVQFGANVGTTNNFNALNITGYVENGFFTEKTPQHLMCFLYQTITSGFPTSLSTVYQLPANTLGFVLGKLAPGYADLGCPKPLYPNTGIPIVGGAVGAGDSS